MTNTSHVCVHFAPIINLHQNPYPEAPAGRAHHREITLDEVERIGCAELRMAKDVIMREIHQKRGRGRAILDFC
jgi:hypothetical protein